MDRWRGVGPPARSRYSSGCPPRAGRPRGNVGDHPLPRQAVAENRLDEFRVTDDEGLDDVLHEVLLVREAADHGDATQ